MNTDAFGSASHDTEDFSDVFVSADQLNEFWQVLNKSILEPLGLDGNVSKARDAFTSRILRESGDRSAADSSPSPASHGPGTPAVTPPLSQQHDRRHLPRGGDFPPGFEDEYEINGKLRAPGSQGPSGGQGPSAPFTSIGERDLYPPGLGPNPTLGGPNLGPFGGGGGMHPTMEEIMRQGGRGPGNGENPDDFLMRPPGSRWDPTGPGDRQGGRGGFGGGFGGGGFGGGFGGNSFM